MSWCRDGLVSSGNPPRDASFLNAPSRPLQSFAEVSKYAASSPRISVTCERLTARGAFRSTLLPHSTAAIFAGVFNLFSFALAARISLSISQTSLKDSLSSKLNTSRKMSPERKDDHVSAQSQVKVQHIVFHNRLPSPVRMDNLRLAGKFLSPEASSRSIWYACPLM